MPTLSASIPGCGKPRGHCPGGAPDDPRDAEDFPDPEAPGGEHRGPAKPRPVDRHPSLTDQGAPAPATGCTRSSDSQQRSRNSSAAVPYRLLQRAPVRTGSPRGPEFALDIGIPCARYSRPPAGTLPRGTDRRCRWPCGAAERQVVAPPPIERSHHPNRQLNFDDVEMNAANAALKVRREMGAAFTSSVLQAAVVQAGRSCS